MHRRRLQLVGGTTYTISLPKEWVKKNKFKEQDELVLYEGKDKTLMISAHSDAEKASNEISLNIDEYPGIADTILRSLFNLGFESITLFSKSQIKSDTRAKIRKALSKLSGVEITYEDEYKISLRVLLDKSKLSITQLLFRSGLVLESSLSMLSGKWDASAIRFNENEMDRLYSLTTKIIIVSLSDSNTLHSSNIKDVSYIPSYFLISKKMENIGDIVNSLSEYMTEGKEDFDKRVEIISFFRREIKRCVDHIVKGYPKMFERIDDNEVKKIGAMILKIEDKTVLNYLRDILRYVLDIEKQIITLSFYAHMGRKKKEPAEPRPKT